MDHIFHRKSENFMSRSIMGITKIILLTGNSGGGYEEYQTCQVDQQQQRNHQKKLSEASRSYSTGKLSKLDAIYILLFSYR